MYFKQIAYGFFFPSRNEISAIVGGREPFDKSRCNVSEFAFPSVCDVDMRKRRDPLRVTVPVHGALALAVPYVDLPLATALLQSPIRQKMHATTPAGPFTCLVYKIEPFSRLSRESRSQRSRNQNQQKMFNCGLIITYAMQGIRLIYRAIKRSHLDVTCGLPTGTELCKVLFTYWVFFVFNNVFFQSYLVVQMSSLWRNIVFFKFLLLFQIF